MLMASISDSETTNRGSMWELDQNLDQPMDEEASQLKNMYREKKFSSMLLLRLAFQSLGVVFGDLGTSPLYVFYNIFPHGVDEDEDVIGALSLIIYTLTLIPLMKYVFVVLRANDNGQGGTFALYSLLCRHAKVSTIPNQHKTDEELTTYSRQTYEENSLAAKVKRWLEGHAYKKNCLLILVLIGTCTAIGDGILTPAISVLSASGGIRVQNQNMSTDVVVIVAVVILIGLFCMQHYGTDKVGWLFAPLVLLWFILIGSVGAVNIHKYNSSVLRAYNPVYIFRYFRRGKSEIWTSLGGVMLSITGTAVVIVMLVTTFLMVPVMLLVWKSHWILVVIFLVLSLTVELPYFTACINKVDQGGWVPLVIAITFFIIMYVWHFCTVKRYEFEMHSKVSMAWILGLGPSLGLVRVPGIGFVYTELASGVPHIFSHFITNLPAIHSVVVFVCVKYLPVYTVPVEERFIMKRIGPKNYHMFRCVARYGYKDIHKKDEDFEKMLLDRLLIFVRLESMMDGYSDSEDFTIMEQKAERSTRALLTEKAGSNTMSSIGDMSYSSQDSIVPAKSPLTGNSLTRYSSQTFGDEQEFLNRCKDAGVVHILGNTVVLARRDSGIVKKVAVNYVYAFLRKLCRENSVIFNVPHESLLNVGQIYYI
ncbi:putative potassium transporter 12 [Dichanthelium oligosanthes]|uniref:Putative potassium transporter 12 n=1 Tax=Dichanthelium oligosanthes TaxID=888268 RepID=A0A1E5WL96_9POAL|nr:putative potassium transporter 12 [Dichanthelium oligosanthes]